MKKRGKAGLGHLTKMEKISKQLATGRAVLAEKLEHSRKEFKPRRHCG
jgi:hypothetical protein